MSATPTPTRDSFRSARWGKVIVTRRHYGEGQPAVVLTLEDGEPLATLSVNMYRPECSHDSRELPKDCFYVKTWSENEQIAADALASGLFVQRPDLPTAHSGYVTAPVWQFAKASTQEPRHGE